MGGGDRENRLVEEEKLAPSGVCVSVCHWGWQEKGKAGWYRGPGLGALWENRLGHSEKGCESRGAPGLHPIGPVNHGPRATSGLVCHLVLYDPQAGDGFYIFEWLKKISQNIL